MTEINYIESSRKRYFDELFKKNKSVSELISFFYTYNGPIYGDQISLLLSELNRVDEDSALNPWLQDQLFEFNGGLGDRALQRLAKDKAELYFSPRSDNVQNWQIFASSENEHRSIRLPFPLSQRLHLKRRPEFVLHHIGADRIFVTPNGFCVFEKSSRSYWEVASSRRYPSIVCDQSVGSISGPVVLIQDQWDGGNFSHFLFDWIFRIVVFCDHVADAKDFTFIMGGKPTDFHREVMSCLVEWLGLKETSFFWPDQEMVFSLEMGIYTFSDVKLSPSHPAYMAHKYAIDIIANIADRLKIVPGNVERVYISREDAALRRVVDERQLIERLTSLRYEPVSLSKLTVRDQFSVVSGARSIIAPHGMGLTHVALRNRAVDLLELFHPTGGTDAYAFISRAKGYPYAHLVGKDLKDGKANYHIDVEEVFGIARNMS